MFFFEINVLEIQFLNLYIDSVWKQIIDDIISVIKVLINEEYIEFVFFVIIQEKYFLEMLLFFFFIMKNYMKYFFFIKFIM